MTGWFGENAPLGWLVLNGQAVLRTEYPTLFSILGIMYGEGDGTDTFNIPNMCGRVAVGKSTDSEFAALGKTGGAKTHKLTTTEMAGSHSHSVSGTAASAGGNGAHNNLQPYIVLNYIIKAK